MYSGNQQLGELAVQSTLRESLTMNGCVFRILKTLQFGSKSAVPWPILWTGLALWLHPTFEREGRWSWPKPSQPWKQQLRKSSSTPKTFPSGKEFRMWWALLCGELVKTSNQLPKRLVLLQFADYEFGIEFVGAITSCPPRIGDEILVVSVKMVMYVNIPSLETWRLWYWRKLKTMTVPKMEGEERPSKALKCDIPEVTVATLDSAPEGTAVFLVGRLRAVTPQDVVNVISFSANSMKFAAEIEADNAQAQVDWWSNEAGFKELFGEGVPWTDLWERCETQEGLEAGIHECREGVSRATECEKVFFLIIEGSLEVKLPTIWTVEKQRWKESEEKRSEERRCRCAKR